MSERHSFGMTAKTYDMILSLGNVLNGCFNVCGKALPPEFVNYGKASRTQESSDTGKAKQIEIAKKFCQL
jgi:hypothetical protein